MFAKRPLPLTDFMATLQTFDIVLMHGLFPSSLAIESIQGADWSHAAIVVVAGDLNLKLPNVPPTTRLLWESNINDTVVDVISNAPKDGPMLTRLSDRLSYNLSVKYDSDVAARNLHLTRTPAMFGLLKTVMADARKGHFPGTPGTGPNSDNGMGEMMNFMMGRLKNQPVTDNTYFCSQLVAHTYKALGLLTQAYVDNSYAPVDFADALDVSLLAGWLGRERLLDLTTVPPYTAA